ncbi:hypothetical protein AOE01nite_14090 [Acetobacter oeni]|uniref:Uncharacterized protein n=1 Tax=Acetobacter oeni TaxID=304077 RepID=A0A511XJQ5_9PROT|nr:hypothetical protein [Acetobacter oeni]GEN63185.1 hypothetical protein AOE01nite_14090 [Acetobacter oeni]
MAVWVNMLPISRETTSRMAYRDKETALKCLLGSERTVKFIEVPEDD